MKGVAPSGGSWPLGEAGERAGGGLVARLWTGPSASCGGGDHLTPHDVGSLDTAFEPSEAKRLMARREWVSTPTPGRGLTLAALDLSVWTRPSRSERLGSEAAVAERARPWARARTQRQIGVDWPFTTPDARTKLQRLYPNIKT